MAMNFFATIEHVQLAPWMITLQEVKFEEKISSGSWWVFAFAVSSSPFIIANWFEVCIYSKGNGIRHQLR